MNNITEKRCPCCETWKQVADFYKNKRTRDGLHGLCKLCTQEINKRCRRNRSEEQIQKDLSRTKKWKLENKDKVCGAWKKWYTANAEYKKKYSRDRYNPNYSNEYYLEHREHYSRINSQWKRNNPEKSRLSSNNRRAKMIEKITDVEWKDLCDKYGNRCLCCKRIDVKLTIDHVIPLDRGGSNTIDNIQPLCLSCNCSKGTKSTDYRRQV